MKKLILITTLIAGTAISNAQLQNLDFEQWDNEISEQNLYNRPTGWEWFVADTDIPDNWFYYPPATDAQNQDYALKLSIWYNYIKDMARQTASINYKPSVLKGYYKYTDNIINNGIENVTDYAQVSIYLTKWNDATSQNDTIGVGVTDLYASEEYHEFIVPITYHIDETPDKVTILLDPSLLRRDPNNMFISLDSSFASIFTVDNLTLSENSMVMEDNHFNKIEIYPNPVKDIIQLPGYTGDLKVFDVNGRLLMSKTKPIERVSLQHLPKGIYVLQLINGSKTQYSKIIKE